MSQESVAELIASVTALKAEVAALRQQWATARRRAVAVVSVAVLGTVGVGVAQAATGACPNGLPNCFVADSPALASEMNFNLSTLKDWLEQKVGTAGSSAVTIAGATTLAGTTQISGSTVHTADVRMQLGSTSNAAAASGKALFISSNMGTASGGLEVRHDNLSQGVGIGYNTVYATGSNTDQPLNLAPRGSSPVAVLGALTVSGDLSANSNSWASGPTRQSFVGGRGATTPSTAARCPNGQYVCGFVFNTSYNLNWWLEEFAVECCGL